MHDAEDAARSRAGAAVRRCAGCAQVGRREFLAQSTLLAVAGLLAACGGGGSTGPSASGPLVVRLSNYPALATVGGMAVVDNGSQTGTPIAAVRTGSSSFVALSLVCPHRGTIVELTGSGFYCPGHGAQFAANGDWVGGQPTNNLTAYSTSYDATAGTLTIG
jgi:Rieske Fe-S protein